MCIVGKKEKAKNIGLLRSLALLRMSSEQYDYCYMPIGCKIRQSVKPVIELST